MEGRRCSRKPFSPKAFRPIVVPAWTAALIELMGPPGHASGNAVDESVRRLPQDQSIIDAALAAPARPALAPHHHLHTGDLQPDHPPALSVGLRRRYLGVGRRACRPRSSSHPSSGASPWSGVTPSFTVPGRRREFATV